MFKKLFPILIVMSLLAACATPTALPAATQPPATERPAATQPPPTATARPPTNTPTITATSIPMGTISGRLLGFSGTQGYEDVFVMNGDGSGLINLTKNNPGPDIFPSWSPDGQKVAFNTDEVSGGKIYVVNSDGTGLTQLTDGGKGVGSGGPAWSPDGRKIAFGSNRDGNGEIYVMNADGSGQTRLTDNPAADDAASWSPDGKQIAFCSNRPGQTDVYVMDADGSGVSRLTEVGTGGVGAAYCFPISWSPDGTKLAFTSGHELGHQEVYVIHLDGSGLTCLTCDIPGGQGGAVWSPDGTQILFGDGHSVYAMNADGSNPVRLTQPVGGTFWVMGWQP
jgi:Tol biopolymer transport system component